ncbi:MAG: glycosyltransferase [Spirochaetes bacterium]|nr:glycosyltransferase [Spirochaetota bacterium]
MKTNDKPKLSIIIPTFNEEENIEKFLTDTNRVLKDNKISHELIVVDDIGKDDTRIIVKNLMKKISEIRLIERDTDTGLTPAMFAGYNSAAGDYLGAMDADLCHNPKYLPEMMKILEKDQADFVIGSRYIKGSRYIGKPFINKLAGLAGKLAIRFLLNLPCKDTSNNFRIFKRKIWTDIKEEIKSSGNIMFVEIIWLAHRKHYRIKEIPTVYIERRFGKSKLNIARETFRFFKNIIKMRFK